MSAPSSDTHAPLAFVACVSDSSAFPGCPAQPLSLGQASHPGAAPGSLGAARGRGVPRPHRGVSFGDFNLRENVKGECETETHSKTQTGVGVGWGGRVGDYLRGRSELIDDQMAVCMVPSLHALR